MAVKIRLKRTGKKKQPSYRVVVADSRSPRDGRIIEQIGRYDPRQEPSLVEIDNDRAQYWLSNGAQPTERAQKLLEIAGAVAMTTGRGGVYRLDTGEVEAAAPQPKAVETTPVEEVPVETPPVETPPVEEMPVEETPAEEVTAAEAVSEEAPVEEAPVEEAASDDAGDETSAS
jgi:small subunit ribosomal protein S16